MKPFSNITINTILHNSNTKDFSAEKSPQEHESPRDKRDGFILKKLCYICSTKPPPDLFERIRVLLLRLKFSEERTRIPLPISHSLFPSFPINSIIIPISFPLILHVLHHIGSAKLVATCVSFLSL